MHRFAWLLLFLAACSSVEPPPKTPLTREKFGQVLMQALLIEARTGRGINVDFAMPDVKAEYQEMFRKEGVSQADFDSTYNAYLRRPELLKAVYEEVLNDLQQQTDTATVPDAG